MKPEQLRRGEILRYLRTPDLEDELAAVLEACIKEFCAAAQPRSIWRVLPVVHTEAGVTLGGLPLGGADIAEHLTGCNEAVLLSATLSAPVDTLIRRAGVTDMTKAVMYDAIAAEALEHVCEELEQSLHETLDYRYFTERFSAGYGDFPIVQQGDLVRLLDATRKIGITVTPQHTLIPMKSVTAVMGLSQHPVKDARRFCCGTSCALCPNRETCTMKKE